MFFWRTILVWAVAIVVVAGLRAERVRVATYNVLNYLPMDRRFEGQYRPAFPKPEQEKAALRAVIREVSPDVLALQEVGAAPYLEELRQDLAREGARYEHSFLLEAADAERHVAVLSRLPFLRVTPHRELEFVYFGQPERVKRGLLEVSFASEAGEWTLFVVHLKSRYTDRQDDPMSAGRRLLEARCVRDLVLERTRAAGAARYAVAGDLNDTRDSRPLAALLRRGSTTLLRDVPAADSRGETWTHRYQPGEVFTRVDYILVSPALWPHVAEQRGRVYDAPGALDGSDHRLVYLDLNLGGATNAAEDRAINAN